MIEVLIEVGSVHNRFGVVVLAENIREALSAVEARYPGGEPHVVFPIEPEAFFVRNPAVRGGAVSPVAQARVAS